VGANKVAIQPKLRNKVPPILFMFLEQRRFWILFGIGFCILMLYGPVVGHPDHNGYRYLLGPVLCPMACAIYMVVRPFNPYKGFAARLGGMIDSHESEPDARRLLELFKSDLARHHIWRTTAKVSGVLFLFMAIAAAVLRNSLNWTILSPWFGQGLIGGCLGSFVAIGAEYIGWGLKTWASQDSGLQAD
jgi:hypothetical protein